jgi:UPF0176 protein
MFLHYSGYRFFSLEEPQSLREEILAKGRELDIRGTLLLGREGCNAGISGTPEKLDAFEAYLQEQHKFPVIEWKVTSSETHTYRRMLVKVKKEIVTTGHTEIRPDEFTGAYLSPAQMHEWLGRENRDFLLLDTRNDYEVRLGKFKGAMDLGTKSFRSFLEKLEAWSPEEKKKPVVTYCTGGIRCEKATAIMLRKMGFEQVWQLEGGIIKYLEEYGAGHFEGECFVFDQRLSVDGNLQKTDVTMCHGCRGPLKPHDLLDPRYVEGESCAYCYEMKQASAQNN